jgi:hypothetical protein
MRAWAMMCRHLTSCEGRRGDLQSEPEESVPGAPRAFHPIIIYVLLLCVPLKKIKVWTREAAEARFMCWGAAVDHSHDYVPQMMRCRAAADCAATACTSTGKGDRV